MYLLGLVDIVDGLFKAMPLAVMQFVYNSLENAWYDESGHLNWFTCLSFATQIISVLMSCIQLN